MSLLLFAQMIDFIEEKTSFTIIDVVHISTISSVALRLFILFQLGPYMYPNPMLAFLLGMMSLGTWFSGIDKHLFVNLLRFKSVTAQKELLPRKQKTEGFIKIVRVLIIMSIGIKIYFWNTVLIPSMHYLLGIDLMYVFIIYFIVDYMSLMFFNLFLLCEIEKNKRR